MSKRPLEELLEESTAKKAKAPEYVKKHTLDSDEEDSDVDEERYNVMDDEDLGEEDGISGMDGDVKITPFNMKEELEEGHFDGDGHFQWKKEKEITDHWLDNLDWVKIKKYDDERKQKAAERNTGESSGTGGGLADSSSDSEDDENDEGLKKFDVIEAYRRILELMHPGETIKRTLQRLGKNSAKISSIERFRRKKAGIVDESAALVTEITELANNILTKIGNMDIYEETYENIKTKFASKLKDTKLGADNALDIFADEFDAKAEQSAEKSSGAGTDTKTEEDIVSDNVKWEFKWKQTDDELHGPFTTEQMINWVTDGYFKTGVFVRKVGTDSSFNSSNRIDFDLYL